MSTPGGSRGDGYARGFDAVELGAGNESPKRWGSSGNAILEELASGG